jgi:hypothetical protein
MRILKEGGLPERTWPGTWVHDLIAAAGYVPCRDILCDQRTRANIGVRSDVDAAHDHGAPADECAVFNDRCRLLGGRVVPGERRIKLTVDEVSCDPATCSYPAVIADVALDHRMVVHCDTDSNIGAACHQDPWPNYGSGLDADEILECRIGTNRHALPDGGVLTDPHAGPYDDVTVSS